MCPCRVTSFIQRLGAHPSFDQTSVHQVFVVVDLAIFPPMSRCSVPLCRKLFSALRGIFLSNRVGGHTLASPNPLIADGFPIVGAHQRGCPCIIQSVAGPVVPHGSHARISPKVSFEACTSSRVTGGPVSQSAKSCVSCTFGACNYDLLFFSPRLAKNSRPIKGLFGQSGSQPKSGLDELNPHIVELKRVLVTPAMLPYQVCLQ